MAALPQSGDKGLAMSPTSSRSVTKTVNGSHSFVIQGYSLAKGMGVGKHIASDTFTVRGYQWAVYFYPDGKDPEDSSTYVSVFIALASEGTDVRALFELTLLDQSGESKHKVHSHFDRSLESGPYTLKHLGSMWGYKRFFRRDALETSDFLKDDCLNIECTVGVVVSKMYCSRLDSIHIPESDIGIHFGTLLENQEGSDIVFDVAGEKFNAHKLVLAARSPVFRSECFDCSEDNKSEIIINDLDPKVFKAILHFIYTDTLVEEELVASNLPSTSSVSDTLIGKLLAAADKYGLERLRLLCESYLCEDISVNSVASTLALADRYHAQELRAVCLKFAAENLAGIMGTEVDGKTSLRHCHLQLETSAKKKELVALHTELGYRGVPRSNLLNSQQEMGSPNRLLLNIPQDAHKEVFEERVGQLHEGVNQGSVGGVGLHTRILRLDCGELTLHRSKTLTAAQTAARIPWKRLSWRVIASMASLAVSMLYITLT